MRCALVVLGLFGMIALSLPVAGAAPLAVDTPPAPQTATVPGPCLTEATPPTLSNCPSDVSQPADAGTCTGTVTLVPPTLTDNYHGHAVDFSGTGFISSSQTVFRSDVAFTYAFWLRAGTPQPDGPYGVGVFSHGFLPISTGSIEVRFFDGVRLGIHFVDDFAYEYTFIGATPLVDGTWHHVAFTYELPFLSMWVDGVLDTAFPNVHLMSLSPSSHPVALGMNHAGSPPYMIGALDEMAIYGRALGQAEIQALLCRVPDTGDPALLAYWPFDDNPPFPAATECSGPNSYGDFFDLDPNVAWVDGALGPCLTSDHPGTTYPAGTTTVTFTGSDPFGNTNTCSVDVTILSPLAPATTGASRCGPGTVNLGASGAGAGESYRWYAAPSGGAILQSGATFTTPILSQTTTYHACIYNTTNLCESPRTAVTATVNAAAGVPTIGAITDVSSCAVSGIQVTYTAGSGATTHDLYMDSNLVVSGYVSGATFLPGDPGPHSYTVVARTAACSSAPSAPLSFTDVADTPTAVTGLTVTNPDCAGAFVTFTASPQALGYELWVDGSLVGPALPGGTTYTPADRASHSYVVRAVRNACHADSGAVAFAVTKLTPPSVGSLFLGKMGSNLLISWNVFLDPTLVDYYEVMRSDSGPAGPFDQLVGTASGSLNGILVNLNAEPPDRYYQVRAVKGICRGPLD